MTDPKDMNWGEIVEDAQRVHMLRLQNEQNDLLREMSAKASPTPTPAYREPTQKELKEYWEKKYGFKKEDNPVEWERLQALQREELEKERLHKLRLAEIGANEEARRLDVLSRRAKRKPWLIAGAVLVGLWFFGNLLF